MQILNPAMLALLGIIPILILIHTLKPKPRQVDVTNLFLWQEVLKARSRHLTFERLKKNLPLLFQIMVVILATLALAKPTWMYISSQKGNMILVIDTSASMKTKAGSGTRFDMAREKAIELIGKRDPAQKILIVEDNSDMRAYIRDLLKKQYRLFEAGDGRSGLNTAKAVHPDLIISDLMMPYMDGEELIRSIRATPELSHIPVIILTAKITKEPESNELLVLANDFLSKPFDPAELTVRVRVGERVLSLETRDIAIFALARLAESRDLETGKHLERVQRYCRTITNYLYKNEKIRPF